MDVMENLDGYHENVLGCRRTICLDVMEFCLKDVMENLFWKHLFGCHGKRFVDGRHGIC